MFSAGETRAEKIVCSPQAKVNPLSENDPQKQEPRKTNQEFENGINLGCWKTAHLPLSLAIILP